MTRKNARMLEALVMYVDGTEEKVSLTVRPGQIPDEVLKPWMRYSEMLIVFIDGKRREMFVDENGRMKNFSVNREASRILRESHANRLTMPIVGTAVLFKSGSLLEALG